MKMMKNNTLIIVSILFLLIIFGGFIYVNKLFDNKVIYTDTIITRDTIIDRDTVIYFKNNPMPVYKTVVKVDTVFSQKGDAIELLTENKTYIDTVCAQKDTAIITSYMSGINAKQDSLRVEMRTTKETITNTIEVTKYIAKPKKINIGLQGGYGFGLKSKQFEPYIGLGVSVSF